MCLLMWLLTNLVLLRLCAWSMVYVAGLAA
jgi:hypothetical protein